MFRLQRIVPSFYLTGLVNLLDWISDLSCRIILCNHTNCFFVTVIDSISPAIGSTAGGQLITITGDFFDESKADAEVLVGNTTCTVESVTDTQILCRTPAEPDSSPNSYPGRC